MRRRAAYEPSLIVETTRTGPPPYKTSSLSTGNAGVPPQCVSVLTRGSPQPSVLSSSSSCNEEFSSSSSQRVDEVSTPPAQPEKGKSKYRPREFDAIRRVPSSYRPVPTDREVGKRWDIYRKQLASLFRRIVLWEPRTLDPSSSPTLSESLTTPLPDPPHGTSPLVSSSEPNTVKQAPLFFSHGSSRPAHDSTPRDIETTEQTLSQAYPLPDVHASLPSRNRVRARMPEPAPLILPASPSSHNEGTTVSSPSRHIAGMTTYPPAHRKIETSKYQPHEHNRTGHALSAYPSPSIKKSMSAPHLSRSGLPASSSPLTRAMSASGSGLEAESRSRPREHPQSTRRTNKVPVANDDGNQRFPSTVRTVLSGNSRYALDAVS